VQTDLNFWARMDYVSPFKSEEGMLYKCLEGIYANSWCEVKAIESEDKLRLN
jgi:hypothetical protein